MFNEMSPDKIEDNLDVDRCIDVVNYQSLSSGPVKLPYYTSETYYKIKDIFELASSVTSNLYEGCKEFWVWIPKCSFEKYAEFYDLDKRLKKTKEYWKSDYPNENVFYNVILKTDGKDRAIFVNGLEMLVITSNRNMPREDFATDFTNFVEWIYEAIKRSILMAEDGMYFEFINEYVPWNLRSGEITQKELWGIFDNREEFFDGISDFQIDHFLELIKKQPDFPEFTDYVIDVTADDFYHWCSLGYKANGFENTDFSEKEQYYENADGRDDGLSFIKEDSPQAYNDWVTGKTSVFNGSHPWEVFRAGPYLSVTPVLYEPANTYMVHLWGCNYKQSLIAARFYCALRDEGVPVYLHDSEVFIARFTGEEIVGVAPEYTPLVRQWGNYSSYMTLPHEDEVSSEVLGKLIQTIKWNPLNDISFKLDSGND